MISRKQWLVAIFAVVLVTTALGAIHVKREFVASCTVRVTDQNGHPVSNIRVSEGWNAYSNDLSGGGGMQTDVNGVVAFPAQFARHSALFWALSPIRTRLNYGAHASSETSATIGISEPGLESHKGDVNGFTCTDQDCINHPLELEMKITRP